jgi:uncharacterized protein YuzE
MTIRIASIDFDRVSYDADADVLYLAADEPELAVDFDETPEGHAVRFDATGRIIGITIVDARKLIDAGGPRTSSTDGAGLVTAAGKPGEGDVRRCLGVARANPSRRRR